jgi:hypothetical protein
MTTQFQSERAAAKALDNLLDQAESCQRLFVEAGMAIPEPLKRLFGDGAFSPTIAPRNPTLLFQLTAEELANVRPSRSKTAVPKPPTQPDHGAIPAGADNSWVSILASAASPWSLALAIMRIHEGTISSAELNQRIADLRERKGGAGYATLPRLVKAGIIQGNNDAWTILDRSKGGIFAGKWLWAKKSDLNVYDMAAVRREAIMILLSENEALTNSAITKSMESCSWNKADVNQHLIKADLRGLEKDKLVRQLPTKVWEKI